MNGGKYLKLSTSLVLLWTVFLVTTANAELKVQTADPTVGLMNQDLNVTLTGMGFDENTRVSIFLDSGNNRAITGSVDTPDFAYGVSVVEKTV